MNPTTTTWMKKQMSSDGHRKYAQELHRLAAKFPFNEALEIGCAWGISTLALLIACPKGNLTSVDNDSYKNAYKIAKNEVRSNGLEDRWTFILSDSKDFWQRRNDKKYDLIYIDGDHSYEYAHLDISKAWTLLKSGGILAIDDAAHKNNRLYSSVDPYGVSISIMEHWMNNPNIKEAGFEGRIFWFKKP